MLSQLFSNFCWHCLNTPHNPCSLLTYRDEGTALLRLFLFAHFLTLIWHRVDQLLIRWLILQIRMPRITNTVMAFSRYLKPWLRRIHYRLFLSTFRLTCHLDPYMTRHDRIHHSWWKLAIQRQTWHTELVTSGHCRIYWTIVGYFRPYLSKFVLECQTWPNLIYLNKLVRCSMIWGNSFIHAILYHNWSWLRITGQTGLS